MVVMNGNLLVQSESIRHSIGIKRGFFVPFVDGSFDALIWWLQSVEFANISHNAEYLNEEKNPIPLKANSGKFPTNSEL